MPNFKRSLRRWIKRLIDNRLVYFHVAKNPDSVMLTFDDGPHAEYTPKILNLLDEYNARAVFFLIGRLAERDPGLVKEIHRRGHCIGNHTHSHLNDYRNGTYSFRQYLAEIRSCQDLLRSITGVETKLFRPPRGELNLKSVTATLWSNHRLIYWSLEVGEWGRRSEQSADEIALFVSETIKPKDIVLLHDDNEKTIRVLEYFLPLAAERNYDLRHNSLMDD